MEIPDIKYLESLISKWEQDLIYYNNIPEILKVKQMDKIIIKYRNRIQYIKDCIYNVENKRINDKIIFCENMLKTLSDIMNIKRSIIFK